MPEVPHHLEHYYQRPAAPVGKKLVAEGLAGPVEVPVALTLAELVITSVAAVAVTLTAGPAAMAAMAVHTAAAAVAVAAA